MPAAKPARLVQEESGNTDMFSPSPDSVKKLFTDELIIGLCAPAGSPVHKVADELRRLLEERYGYSCEVIRLSRLIEDHSGAAKTGSRSERIHDLIDKGNELRRKYGASVLADLAISRIAADRESLKQANSSEHYTKRRACYIIDSIKNSQELEILRHVYREMFYFISVFAPVHVRQKQLESEGMNLEQVYAVIDRDSGEELGHGQTVRDTFHQADFFVRAGATGDADISARLVRFVDLILRAKLLTPTPAETAMYQAASAAGNSACLSRQVGAAITDSNGKMLSIGWNDVPRYGGGLYRFDPERDPTSAHDHRCVNWKGGKCFNDEEKDLLTKKVIDELINSGLLQSDQRAQAVNAIRSSPIRALIEFSRAIHAEMHAVLSAVEHGAAGLKGGKLYCTTYPCHACARHLVAAGISEIYYIEPYRKSQALKLHEDAVTEDEGMTSKLRILPFDGVAPSRYLDLFSLSGGKRKEAGQALKVDARRAHPVAKTTLESIPTLEGLVVESLVRRNLLRAG